jgi:hypothetical protein
MTGSRVPAAFAVSVAVVRAGPTLAAGAPLSSGLFTERRKIQLARLFVLLS